MIRRFVVASSYYPPAIGGTSTVMRNLLSAFKPELFSVVSERMAANNTVKGDSAPGVHVQRVGLPGFIGEVPYGAKISRWLRFGMILRIERMILATRPDLIIAVYPSWPFLIAAYRAHRRSGIPLCTYHMDVTVEADRLGYPDRAAVHFYEAKILRAAAQRLVLTDAIAEDFEERFGLGSEVVPHSINLKNPLVGARQPPILSKWGSKKLILHTGVVEGLQRDGLLRLAWVLEAHPELNARLLLSTPTPRSELVATGFGLSCVEIGRFTSSEVAALQRTADILVAVLPFQGAIESYEKTAFPTKVVEYMAAEIPILGHAPPNSFFGRHISRYGYAHLAGLPDEQSLFTELDRLLNDEPLRQRLIQRSRATVREVFDLNIVSSRFLTACNLSLDALRHDGDL